MGFKEDLAAFKQQQGGATATPLEGAVSKDATTEAPQSSFAADLAAFKASGGVPAPEPESNQFLDSVEGAAKKAGQFGQDAVDIASQVSANLASGTAHGIDQFDAAMMNAGKALPDPLGLRNLDPFGAKNEPPLDLSSEVDAAYRHDLERGKKEHPLISEFARGTGELLPTIPAWETGAGLAGSALKFGGGAVKAAAPVLGPAGAALVQGASKTPEMLQKIMSLVATGSSGAFVAGMQEEATKQGSKAGGNVDMGKVIQAGVKMAADAAPVMGGLGIIGEGIAKGISKVKELRLTHQEKMAQKAEVEAYDKRRRAELSLEEKAKEAIKKRDAEMAREDAAEALQAKIREQREAQLKEMQSALDDRKAQLAELDRRKKLLEKQRTMDSAQKKLTLAGGVKKNAAPQAPKKPKPPTEEELALDEEAKALREKLQAERAQMQAVREEHAQRLEEEHKAFMERVKGQKPQVGATPEKPVEAPVEEPVPQQTGPAQFSLKAEKKVVTPEATAAYDAPPEFRSSNDRQRVKVGDQTKFRTKATPERDNFFDSDDWTPTEAELAKVPSLADLRAEIKRKQKALNEDPAAAAINKEEAEAVEFVQADADALKFIGENPGLLFGGSPDAIGLALLARVLKKIPKELWTYDTIMHGAGVQKDTDILTQYAPDLLQGYVEAGKAVSELGGGLAEMFSKARGRLSFTQMGAGKIEPDLLKAGLTGRLFDPKRFAKLPEKVQKAYNEAPPEVKRALQEGHAVVQKYLEEVKPILAWLEEHTEGFNTNSGLGRLHHTLKGHVESLTGSAQAAQGNAEKGLNYVKAGLMAWKFLGKAANSVIHMAEKGVALVAHEGLSLPKAIVKAYEPGGSTSEFVNQFLSGADGPLTESLEDQGIKVARKGLASVLTGQVIERSPNRVAAAVGLDKAAKKLGYKSGDALADDILAARQGKGPLAHDSDKLTEAMRITQDYVSNITGLNVPGFKDRNVFQRNKGIANALGVFLTMPTVQSRNFHLILRRIATAKSKEEAAKAAAEAGVYLTGLYIVAGDKGPIDRAAEPFVREAVGARNWYKFMDNMVAGRAITHLDELPSINHLQQSLVPMVSGGASITQMTKEAIQKASSGDMDPAKKAERIAQAIGPIAGMQLLGMFGGGVAINYMNAIRDGQRGYEVMHVYENKPFGAQVKRADVPIKTDIPTALAKAYFGTHSKVENEAHYHAEKTMDLREWVRKNGDALFFKEALEDEKELDAVADLKELDQEKNEIIADLKEDGYKDDSPEIQSIKEQYTKMAAEDNKHIERWHARAEFWAERADEVQEMLDEKAKQAPEKPGVES